MSDCKTQPKFTPEEQAQLHIFATAGAARYTAQQLQITKLLAGTLPFIYDDPIADPHGLTDYNKTFYPGQADPKIIPVANRILRATTGVKNIDEHASNLATNLKPTEDELKERPLVLAVGHAGFFEGTLALEVVKRARALYHAKEEGTDASALDFNAYFKANRAAHGVATRGFMPVTLGLPISSNLGRRLHIPDFMIRQSFVENVFLRAGTSHYSIPATDRSKATAKKLGIDPELIRRYNTLFKANWQRQANNISSFESYNTFTIAPSGTSDRKDKKSGETFIQPVRGRTAELATSIGATIIPVFISLKKNNGRRDIIELGSKITPEHINADTLHEIETQRAIFRVLCGEKSIYYADPR